MLPAIQSLLPIKRKNRNKFIKNFLKKIDSEIIEKKENKID